MFFDPFAPIHPPAYHDTMTNPRPAFPRFLLTACLLFSGIFAAGLAQAAAPDGAAHRADEPDVRWFHRGGKRFFPIGMSNDPDGTGLATIVSAREERIEEVARAGVNWAWENMNGARGEPLLDNALLDRCGKHGIHVSAVAMNWNPDHNWITKDSFHVPGSEFDRAVRDIMGNPFLLTYYGMDEAIVLVGVNGWPRGHEPYYPVTYDTLLGARRFLHGIDASRPLIYFEGNPMHCVAEFGEADTRRWVNGIADVVGINYYPVRDSHPWPANDLLGHPAVMLDQMARLLDPDDGADGHARYAPAKTLIAAWQGGPTSPAGRRPRLEEMRANVYSLVIHGARGLLSWGEGFLDLSKPEDRQCWGDCKRVIRELADLQPVLVSDDVAYSFWQSTPPPYVPDWRLVRSGGLEVSRQSVIGVVREHDGHRYLLAMNWGNEDLGTVSITVPGWKAAASGGATTVLFEDRTVATAGETWSDTFGPWTVHIYSDKTADGGLPR